VVTLGNVPAPPSGDLPANPPAACYQPSVPVPRQRSASDLLEITTQRSRRAMHDRLDHLRDSWLNLLLTALCASLAWLIAREAFSDRAAFFAPIAAILTLGLAVGQRGRRAFEIGLGVALGIGIADLLVLAIGDGTWQLGVVVALAMAAAVLAGGGPLLVNQAAISGALVVALQNGAGAFSGTRFIDAVIGSAVALLANALIPSNPLRMVRREAEPLLRELGGTLEQVARALEAHDVEGGRAALDRARALDLQVERLREALDVGQETTTLAPSRRRARGGLAPYANAVSQIDHAVRNTRVLARRAVGAIEQDDRVPEMAIDAIRELAIVLPDLAAYLADPGAAEDAEAAMIQAAAHATAALDVTSNLSANMIVGQVRSMAVDLLGVAGVEADEAREAVREARIRTGI